MATDGPDALLSLGGQAGDLTAGDLAGGNIDKRTQYGLTGRDMLSLVIQIREIVAETEERNRLESLARAETEERERLDRDLRRELLDSALDALRAQLATVRHWLLWLTIALIAAGVLIIALIADRALMALGALLTLAAYHALRARSLG